ncbi:MAG: hypothetical protein ACLP56_06970, partial [Candidatus Sulfotelmatobacter sp.]
SFSIFSAASATVLLTRADASSTLRLKSFIMLLAAAGREPPHAVLADTDLRYYFVVWSAGSIDCCAASQPVYYPFAGI